MHAMPRILFPSNICIVVLKSNASSLFSEKPTEDSEMKQKQEYFSNTWISNEHLVIGYNHHNSLRPRDVCQCRPGLSTSLRNNSSVASESSDSQTSLEQHWRPQRHLRILEKSRSHGAKLCWGGGRWLPLSSIAGLPIIMCVCILSLCLVSVLLLWLISWDVSSVHVCFFSQVQLIVVSTFILVFRISNIARAPRKRRHKLVPRSVVLDFRVEGILINNNDQRCSSLMNNISCYGYALPLP